MENRGSCGSGGGWWLYAIPLLDVAILVVAGCAVVVAWLSNKAGNGAIPGLRGFPIIGSLVDMTRFHISGAFNWVDHLPWLLLRGFVRNINEEHRLKALAKDKINDNADVLLSLNGEDKLDDEDMISLLWEMIFPVTDTTEWTMAEMGRNPQAQRKEPSSSELESVVGNSRSVSDSDICKLPYLEAVMKKTLQMHRPAPLLCDTIVGDGMFSVPTSTTAMVNMWSITHDPLICDSPDQFPAQNVDDLRLAPFAASVGFAGKRNSAFLPFINCYIISTMCIHFMLFPSEGFLWNPNYPNNCYYYYVLGALNVPFGTAPMYPTYFLIIQI